MSTSDEKKPYQPPRITRVVLRQEQAILSQCSTFATDQRDRGSGREITCAFGDDDCKAWDSTGASADFGPSAS